MKHPQGAWQYSGEHTTKTVPTLDDHPGRTVIFPPKEKFFDLNNKCIGTVMPFDNGYGVFWEGFYNDLKGVPKCVGQFVNKEDAKAAVLNKL